MSVDSKIAELFAEAVSAERNDVIAAIASFISIKDVADVLDKNKRLFGDKFKEAFIRAEYSGDDIRALGMESLRKHIKGYLSFYQSLGRLEGIDDDSRSRFIQHYAAHGLYQAAFEAYQQLKDPEAYRQEMMSMFSTYRSLGRQPMLIFLGEPHLWDIHAVRLLSAMQLEMDDDFTEYHRPSQNSPWNHTRFSAQVNAVGDWQEQHCEAMPEAEVIQGEIRFVAGQQLAKAFIDEYQRLNTVERQDGWNAKNFPSYLPVKVQAKDLNALVFQGAIPVKAKVGEAQIEHGFIAHGGQVSPGQVAMAMSLLSLGEIAKAHENPDEQIVLMPASAINAPEVKVDSELNMRMQWHRPEVLRVLLDKDGLTYNYFCKSVSVDLYLRGCPLKGDYLNSSIQFDVDNLRPELFKYFTAQGEREYISSAFGAMKFEQGSNDISAEVQRLLADYQTAVDYMGVDPKLVIRGKLEFMEAVSKLPQEFHVINAILEDFEDPNSHHGNSFCGDYGISKNHRIAARLCGFKGRTATRYGTEPNELLAKALRLKNDENAKEEIKGLLDRFPLLDVVMAAKTDKQAEFVAQNFELASIYSELPAKIRSKIGRTVLSNDFEL
jgi:hypothetical protein